MKALRLRVSQIRHQSHRQRYGRPEICGSSATRRHPSCPFRSISTTTPVYSSTKTNNQMDQICELAASNLRFGPGATHEVGKDVAQQFHAQRVVIFADANVSKSIQTVQESLEEQGVSYTTYTDIRYEPNDTSFQEASRFLQEQENDVVIAVGGGSVMDTAKAANLYACHPPNDFYDYVNPPVGQGLPPPGPLKPLIAIPTTAGTGSETTGVAIFDDGPRACKTGIAHRFLKPTLGIVDSDNTATMPSAVATYSGLDVLCHAIESYTAVPFHQRGPKPSSPLLRPAYQGSNPISDVWSLYALETCAKNIHAAVQKGDLESRHNMLLASSAAGLGFGNAGVHLCHGMSYPVSSQNKSYTAPGYESAGHPIVPHGLSVIVNAPAVFAWTGSSAPERHAKCARILAQARGVTEQDILHNIEHADAGAWLANEIHHLCESLKVPMGLRTFGYSVDDIPAMVEGTIQQHRVTKISPRPVDRAALEYLFDQAL